MTTPIEWDDATVARKFEWQHRCCGMGDLAYGDEIVLKHATEPLLTMRELRVTPRFDGPGYSPPADFTYMLYEYTGVDWGTGEWSQKEFPRAIIIVPRNPQQLAGIRHRFTHRGCEFTVANHMSFTIFHLENRLYSQ